MNKTDGDAADDVEDDDDSNNGWNIYRACVYSVFSWICFFITFQSVEVRKYVTKMQYYIITFANFSLACSIECHINRITLIHRIGEFFSYGNQYGIPCKC